jgi:NDP-sugar pyrophosphorylase family protein
MMNLIEKACQQLRVYLPDFPQFDKPLDLLNHFRTNYKQNTPIGSVPITGEYVEIQPYALFSGLVILGKNVRIGPYTFIRGPVFISDDSKIGPHIEISNSIILDHVSICHKNNIHDSILGSNVYFGGITATCNTAFTEEIKVHFKEEMQLTTGKYGATIDDNGRYGGWVSFMPGSYAPPSTSIPGPAVVYGNGKTKSLVNRSQI